MSFAATKYSGDTASGNHTHIRLYTQKEPSGSTEASSCLRPLKGLHERICKRCGLSFDSLKKKAQICPECKRKRK
jgi:predicted amidophosphoribosyltransferase